METRDDMLLSSAQLSDLFFNCKHEYYDAYVAKMEQPTREGMQNAIMLDAIDFATMYPELGKIAQWYAKDFLQRI